MSAAKKFPVGDSELGEISHAAILSRGWDILAIGGLSLFMYVVIRMLFKPEAPDSTVAMFVFNCSFLINFPHFLVSYQLLYGDFRSEITKKFRFFWAAVIAPAIIGGILIAGFVMHSERTLGYVVNSMYFFVGWHYVKQIFGCVIVTNAMNQFFYNSTERLALKTNLISLWAISFLSPNMLPAAYEQMGIKYASLELPNWTLQVAFNALIVSGIFVIYTHLQKYIREGKLPTPASVISVATIYVWFIPAMSHPVFAHMIPMFHSLQYLLFVYAFRSNKAKAAAGDMSTPTGRTNYLMGLWGYLALSIVLGALAFKLVPEFLDTQQISSLGPMPAVFFATIFINIHHYFIDNVIWRGDNEQMRQHLFKKAS